MAKKLLSPELARSILSRKYDAQHQNWIGGEGNWPLQISLGVPTEKDIGENAAGVRIWVNAWQSWDGRGDVVWEERQFGRLGKHKLPVTLKIETPYAVAASIGQSDRWRIAVERFEFLTTLWPVFKSGTNLKSKFNVLADYTQIDFERLTALLKWLDVNQNSSLYLRQLPIEGLDTKWVEQHVGAITAFMKTLRSKPDVSDFYELCGLRKTRARIRVSILCPQLRGQLGGLRDFEAPVDELAALTIYPPNVVIVENLETGIALPDITDTVAIMKLGNAVSLLSSIQWLQSARAIYWGDIDTHGFAILDRARQVLPQLTSILMDLPTLLVHQPLWGRENVQCPDLPLDLLTVEERAVYKNLRTNKWGDRLRLEQERIPWRTAIDAIISAVTLK